MNPIDLTGRAETSTRIRDFTRYLRCFAMARGDSMQAAATFEGHWPRAKNIEIIRKAAVVAGTTTGTNWAAPLAPLESLASEFVGLIRARTVLGRMQGYRPVPFRISFPRQTSGASVAWVGQGVPMLGSELQLERETFQQSKIAGIVVITQELARASDPAAEALIQADLVDSIVAFSDEQMLDPSKAAVADVSPASLTYGATAIASTGSTAAQVEADLLALVAAIKTNLTFPYLIMKQSTALYLATLRTTSGDRVFPGLGVNGGDIWGIPVLVSGSAPGGAPSGSPPTLANSIVLIDAAEILVADDGIEFDASEQAAIQMNTAPDAPPTATTVFTSLWQMNLVAIMAKRFIRWQMRRAGAVAYISNVPF